MPVGVTLPDEHGIEQYIQKSIRLKCTDETMALDLACTCPGNHWHLPIEGGSRGLGPRAEASGVYQAQFCNTLCRAGPSSKSLSIRAATTPLPLTTSSRPRSLRSLKSLMLIPVNWNHQLQNHLQDVQKARSFTAALDILPERSLCDCGRTSEPPTP